MGGLLLSFQVRIFPTLRICAVDGVLALTRYGALAAYAHLWFFHTNQNSENPPEQIQIESHFWRRDPEKFGRSEWIEKVAAHGFLKYLIDIKILDHSSLQYHRDKLNICAMLEWPSDHFVKISGDDLARGSFL